MEGTRQVQTGVPACTHCAASRSSVGRRRAHTEGTHRHWTPSTVPMVRGSPPYSRVVGQASCCQSSEETVFTLFNLAHGWEPGPSYGPVRCRHRYRCCRCCCLRAGSRLRRSCGSRCCGPRRGIGRRSRRWRCCRSRCVTKPLSGVARGWGAGDYRASVLVPCRACASCRSAQHDVSEQPHLSSCGVTRIHTVIK